MNQALLSFSLGPVQDFIAAARTTRDLWTGSYLLSWLTAHAIAAIVDQGGEILSPDVSGNPLFEAACGRIPKGDGVLSPCLPQMFLACVSGDLQSARNHCENAVRREWRQIADKVHDELDKEWKDCWPGWDKNWPQQIEHFWDIRTVALPEDAISLAQLQRLVARHDSDPFKLRREFLGRIAAADKNIRHYPPHEFDENGKPDTRPKCSLLGSLAQMGPPANMDDFWKGTRTADDRRDWSRSAANVVVIEGSRLGKRDRFCAVSLIKRFAWGAYFKHKFRNCVPRFEFPDVDTICASQWLRDTNIDTAHTNTDDGSTHWSGHWLQWKKPDEGRRPDADEPELCPDQKTFDAIQDAKKKLGAPPNYFGVLILDGDRMGELMRHADKRALKKISGTLAHFAHAEVRPLVETNHHGKLVFTGGDDVLALLPPSTALQCAQEVAERFRCVMRDNQVRHHDGTAVTCSSGLAIAHAKANLRDVLRAARAAEHQAKQEGKDRLTIAVLKRSGEHTSVSCSWPLVSQLAELVGDFSSDRQRRGESDRWAYQFRRELESVLPEVPELLEAELGRLLNRAEGASKEFKGRVQTFWTAFGGRQRVAQAKQFTRLVQSASFLARGGREAR
jgi:CRISPR-associated protein Cmr2